MAKSINAILLVLAAVLVVPAASYAAGLGTITVRSALGQPLDAEIEVVSLQPGEDFQVRLASREAYRDAGVDLSPALQGARFAIEKRDGKTVIRVRTSQPVNDPFFSILVEMQWPTGRLARQYTVLVDPVEYKTASAPAPQAAAPAKAPVVTPMTTPAPARATQSAKPAAQAPTAVAAAPVPAPAAAQPVVVAAPTAPVPAQPTPEPTAVATPASARTPAAEPIAARPEPVPAPAPVTAPVAAPAAASTVTPLAPAASPVLASAQATPVPVAPVTAPQVPTSVAPTAAATTQSPAAASALTPVPTPAPIATKQVPTHQSVDASDTYRIKRGDTLGAIARKWKLDGVTLEQMLVGLYQTNRPAFIRDNINLIRTGATLFIPGREDVVAISAADATRQVRMHMAAFTKYRETAAGAGSGSSRISQAHREVITRRAGVKKSPRAL